MSDQWGSASTTLVDLKRERDDLVRSIEEDNDWHGRDHLPKGRWPMVHAISRQIDALERKTA